MGELVPINKNNNRRKPTIHPEQMKVEITDTSSSTPKIGAKALENYQTSQNELISAYRSQIMKRINEYNFILQSFSKNTFKKQNGLTFTYGIQALQSLTREPSNDPLSDIRNFTNNLRPSDEYPLTERMRAVRILQIEGLGMLESAFKYLESHKDNDGRQDILGSGVLVLKEIGDGLHSDTGPDGAVEYAGDIIQDSKLLLASYRYTDNDSLSAIQELRFGLAETIGFNSPYEISPINHKRGMAIRDTTLRTEAFEILHPPLNIGHTTDPAA